MLPKPLKMANPCNGQFHGHENLLPPSSLSDLLQAFQKPWSIVSLQIKTKNQQDLHLPILEALKNIQAKWGPRMKT